MHSARLDVSRIHKKTDRLVSRLLKSGSHLALSKEEASAGTRNDKLHCGNQCNPVR